MDRKAVIWCEDHGDLAYYEEKSCADAPDTSFFTAGDYVEFDVTIDDTLRRASNAINVAGLERANQPTSYADVVSDHLFLKRSVQNQNAEANVVTLSHHRRNFQEQTSALSYHG